MGSPKMLPAVLSFIERERKRRRKRVGREKESKSGKGPNSLEGM